MEAAHPWYLAVAIITDEGREALTETDLGEEGA
jgi:hypothetical protein